MWLPRGPLPEPLEDTLIALDDPVLVDGSLLHLGGCNSHAKAHFQDSAPWTHKEGRTEKLLSQGWEETAWALASSQREGQLGRQQSGFWDRPGGGQTMDFEPGSRYVHRWRLSLDLVTFRSSSYPPPR